MYGPVAAVGGTSNKGLGSLGGFLEKEKFT